MTVQIKGNGIVNFKYSCQLDFFTELNRTAFLNGIFQFSFGLDYRNIILRKHGHRQ